MSCQFFELCISKVMNNMTSVCTEKGISFLCGIIIVINFCFPFLFCFHPVGTVSPEGGEDGSAGGGHNTPGTKGDRSISSHSCVHT
jgi:hypothetical protein